MDVPTVRSADDTVLFTCWRLQCRNNGHGFRKRIVQIGSGKTKKNGGEKEFILIERGPGCAGIDVADKLERDVAVGGAPDGQRHKIRVIRAEFADRKRINHMTAQGFEESLRCRELFVARDERLVKLGEHELIEIGIINAK